MWLNGISGHGVGRLVFQWGSTMKSSWVHTVASRHTLYCLSVCCSFTSYQHLRSYQDGYRLVTVHTHGDFMMLHSEKPGCQHHDLISHSVTLSWNWANHSLPSPNNAERLANKRQVSILKLLGLTRPMSFRFPDLPKWKMGAFLIGPSCVVNVTLDLFVCCCFTP